MMRTASFRPTQGVPMIAFRRRHLVGHDILLARHGNHICSMRLDRSAGRVVALLDDGTTDSAPNLISPDLHLPETVQGVLRDDWKVFSAISAATAGLGALVFAAAWSFSGTVIDPTMAQMITTYPAF
ncbi:hypothetical protein [Arthrobacter sp. CDRTa11]|uniref:hypothetical protein n=1 Tax=Arthrobacter sp. CDRTa11 TaxID=2651199 RepID=UPI003A5CAA33